MNEEEESKPKRIKLNLAQIRAELWRMRAENELLRNEKHRVAALRASMADLFFSNSE